MLFCFLFDRNCWFEWLDEIVLVQKWNQIRAGLCVFLDVAFYSTRSQIYLVASHPHAAASECKESRGRERWSATLWFTKSTMKMDTFFHNWVQLGIATQCLYTLLNLAISGKAIIQRKLDSWISVSLCYILLYHKWVRVKLQSSALHG